MFLRNKLFAAMILILLSAGKPAKAADFCSNLLKHRQVLVSNIELGIHDSNYNFYAYIASKIEPSKFAVSEYGDSGLRFLDQLSQIHPKLANFIYDPGIINHFESFLIFLKNKGINSQSSFSFFRLREEFSQSLGKRRVYRALALAPDDVIRLQKGGIALKETFNKNTMRLSFFENMKLRLNDEENPSDILQSVSDFPDVAVSVGVHFYHQSQVAEKVLALFELEIPVLDLIPAHIFVGSAKPNRSIPQLSGFWNIHYAGTLEVRHHYSSKLESFVVGKISATAISKVYRIRSGFLRLLSGDFSKKREDPTPEESSFYQQAFSSALLLWWKRKEAP